MGPQKRKNRVTARLLRSSWLLALALGAACSGSTTKPVHRFAEACSLNSDCDKGLVCALGKCREQCITSVDCHGGSCVTDALGGVCQTADEKNSACEQQRDCPLPLACAADYRCRNLCQSAVDCNVLGVSGRVCGTDEQGVKYCADPPEVDVETGKLITTPPPGAPDASVQEPTPGASFSGGAIAFPIGPAGGTLGLGAVTVNVPAGALDRTVNISITPITPPVAGSIGQVYEIGPTGTTFRKPIQIAIAYALAELAGRPATAFAVSTVSQGAWQAVSAPVVDPYIDTITGSTTHLSPYALSALSALGSGGDGSGGSAGDGSVAPSAAGADAQEGGEGGEGGEAGASAGGTSSTAGSATGGAGTSAGAGVGGALIPPGSGGSGTAGTGGPGAGAGGASGAGAGGTAGAGGASAGTLSTTCQACFSGTCSGGQKSCISDPTCEMCATVNYLAPACATDPAFQSAVECLCGKCPDQCATECSSAAP